jgi:uncharacterized protein YacL
MILWTLRALFLLILAGASAKISGDYAGLFGFSAVGWGTFFLFGGLMGLGVIAIALDLAYRRKRIAGISAIYFGLLIGILLGHLLGIAFAPTLRLFEPNLANFNLRAGAAALSLSEAFTLVTTSILCYICVSVIIQTKDDFRFIIPYVEFSRQWKGGQPLILDTSVIIDGRIADIGETGLIDQTLVIPRFVLNELQKIADSQDKLRRNRGRRGLDVVDRLQKCKRLTCQIHDRDFENKTDVDGKLIALAQELNGRLATNDFNLAKAARIQGVSTVSMHEVSNAAKPPVQHGEVLTVRLTKAGEEPGQGVGYLDDGTMVVAEMGRPYVGSEVALVVTSILQTAAGRMVFGKLDVRNPEPPRPQPVQQRP